MKIAVCGAGLVGSYLYRLVSRLGCNQVTVFDKAVPHQTNCGINPCAWGTSIGFGQLVADADLNPTTYILQTFDRLLLNGVEVKISGLVIDKPKFITDLLSGTTIIRSSIRVNDFDRIIDATGVARAYLPAIDDDIVASCIQYRVSTQEPLKYAIDISNMGYAWRGLLSHNEYHIGAGSLITSPGIILDKLGWLKNVKCLCSCSSRIRLTSPHYSLPFIAIAGTAERTPIWGVGEAVGCVAPLAGEGIIPGLKSVHLLLSNWEDPDSYRRAMLKEFSWMKEERQVMDKIKLGKHISLLDAWLFKNTTRRLGINLDLYYALSLLKSVNRA